MGEVILNFVTNRKTKKRILLITNELNTFNGWATVSYYFCKYTSFDIKVITRPSWSKNAHYQFKQFLSDCKKYSSLKGDFDVVFCGVEPGLPLCAYLKWKLKIPKLVLLGQGTYIYTPFIKLPLKLIYRPLMKLVDCLIVPSKFTKNKVKEWYAGKINEVGYGVDINRYKPMDVKQEKALIFVGAQKPRKGVEYLFNSMKLLLQKHPDLKLYLVGGISHNYVSLAKELKIDENVIFVGKVSHSKLLTYFSKSMVHVLPSVNSTYNFEGYGLVHLEANACGIPSIGTSKSANESVIQPGINGFLVKQKNSKDLYECIHKLLSDEKSYSKLVSSSKEYARLHSWSDSIKRIDEVIDSC